MDRIDDPTGNQAGHPSNDLEHRLILFAVRIIHLADELTETCSSRHVSSQILRSGTSPAPNYAEARAAESRNDFIHKLKVVLKELNETRVWLNIIRIGKFPVREPLDGLLDENTQLCRIINASITTARKNKP